MSRTDVFSIVAGIVLCLVGSVSVASGSISVDPVRLKLSADHPVTSVTVSNSGEKDIVILTEATAWTQSKGQNKHTPTTELLADPQIFTLSPGATQIVRLALDREPDTERELSYRLFFEEVPPPPEPDFQGLRVALRIGVPVFVRPAASATPNVNWRISRAAPAVVRIVAANIGNAHIHINRLKLLSEREQILAGTNVSTTLLANQQREWVVKLDRPFSKGEVRLLAETDEGRIDSGFIAIQPR
ncbi:MAG: fimbrial biogenesis chaperone [Methylohalobius sp. ZOD2]|nr:molecular chaperone [Methylothermaceae bacterium]